MKKPAKTKKKPQRLTLRIDAQANPRITELDLPGPAVVLAALRGYAKQQIALSYDLPWPLPKKRDRGRVVSIPHIINRDLLTAFFGKSALLSRKAGDVDEAERLEKWDLPRTLNEILLRYLYADYLPPFPRELPSAEDTVKALREILDVK